MNLDKTYAEEHKQQPFDWNAFLDKEDHSQKEWEDAEELAGNWVTCACGNLCAALPRRPYGAMAGQPEDQDLRILGFQFYTDIEKMDVAKAKATLSEIEKRSALLLKEIYKER